jgi:hypothetical protein
MAKDETKPGVFMDYAGPGIAIIRACSEALFFGVASCFSNDSSIADAIKTNLHPMGGIREEYMA